MSYNPFTYVMNAVSSPAAKKRKVDDISDSATEVTLESIMGEISELKKSNERIESMLKILTGETKVEEKEEEESSKGEEEEVDPEELLSDTWLEKFEELKKFKAKYGHCRITSKDNKQTLQRWVVRQRSEKKTGKMANRKLKLAKLDSLDFDWAPQAQTPAKKSRR